MEKSLVTLLFGMIECTIMNMDRAQKAKERVASGKYWQAC